MKKIIITLSILLIIAMIAFIEFGRKSTPIERHNISTPIYTIGDKTYDLALNDKKTVVKFGPMFMGLYSGGLAFSSPEEAKKYMFENNWDKNKWDIYLLSGDYDIDVTNGHINKSLMVVSKV